MAQDLGLAFRLSADAGGLVAGMAQAEKHLEKVGNSARVTAKDFREAGKVAESVATPTEKYASAIERLDGFLERGLVTQEVYGRAVAKADAELQAATDSTEKYGRVASTIERVLNGVSGAVQGVADATTSVATAGVTVIKFGKDVAWTYLQWKVFSAVKNPAAIAQFGLSALKTAGYARTAILAAKAFGVGLALTGGSAGLAASAVIGLTNPMIGLALTATNLTRAFFASRDITIEMAKSVKSLTLEAAMAGTTFQNLSIQKALDSGTAREDLIATGVALSALDVAHLQGLGDAMERSEKATTRTEQANRGLLATLGSPFTGAMAAITDGTAAMSNGWADLVNGVASIGRPVGAVLRPFGTLLGTIAETAMRVVGAVGSIGGVVLRVGGLAANVLLSPFIVGLNNTANMIRGGLASAFDYLAGKIATVNSYLDKAYNAMSKIPILGAAFQSNEGGVAAAGGAAADAGNAQGAGAPMAAAAEEADNFTNAIGRQESALSTAIERSQQFGEAGFAAAVTYQTGLRDLEGDLERGILNETSFAQAAEKLRDAFDSQVASMEAKAAATRALADEDAAAEQANTAAMTKQTDAFFKAAEAAQQFGAEGAAAAAEYEGGLTALNAKLTDGRINQTAYGIEADKLREKFKGQVDQMKGLAAAQGKRADDVQRMQDRIADAGGFQAEAGAALGKKSGEALQLSDVRSSEGIASFMALATGREDPAIAEYRKSHATLQSMLAELKALQAAPLEIAGGAGG